ncbi:MAG: AI-2E family transporter [Acidimicrobiales bacterium]
MVDARDDQPVTPADRFPTVVALDPRAALGVVAGILAVFLLVALAGTSVQALTQIGVGVLLAFALEPLVKGVQRRLHCPRAVGVAVVAAGVVLGFGVLVFVMGPPAAKQAQEFGQELPKAVRDLYDLPLVGGRLREADAAEEVQRWAEDLPGRLDAERVGAAAETVVNGIVAGFTVLLVAFTVLLDGEVLVRRTREIVPERFRARADDVGRVFYRVVGTYFAGSLLVAVMGGTFVLAVGLALGVPLAPVAAVWYAMVSLIPQVGGFLGTSFFTVLALSQGVFVGLIGLVLLLLT